MKNFEDDLNKFLSNSPDLVFVFVKIADTFEKRRGEMPKTLTLAKEVSFADFAALQSIFGQFLSRNPSGTLKLNYESFSENLPKGVNFIEAVFEALDRKIPQKISGSGNTVFLRKLQLCYPQWAELIGDFFSKGSNKKLLLSADLVEKALKTVTFCFSERWEHENCLRFSNLGARLFNDSKILRPGSGLYNLTADLFVKILDDESLKRKEAFARVGVVENLTAVKVMVFGPYLYKIGEKSFDWIEKLWQNGEPAVLTMQTLKKIKSIKVSPDYWGRIVKTCENETPFNELMEQGSHAVIYTEGYPNSAVKTFLKKLDYSDEIHHWGDSDPEGLEIAAKINEIKPVKLWRCDLASLYEHKDKLIDFSGKKRKKAQILLNNESFPFKEELRFGLENGWLEQEAFTTTKG